MILSPPKHPLGWLGQQSSFKELTDRAQRLLALQADLQSCIPGYALTALRLDDGVLVVATPGAAAAAKLRQREPSVLAALRLRGWSVEKIRFRPRPGDGTVPRPAPRIKPPIPETALAQLRTLSEQASSPGLQQALQQLLRTQQRQRQAR